MALNFRFFETGIKIKQVNSLTLDSAGELQHLSSDNKLYLHNGTSSSALVTETHTATLTNKTLTSPTINDPVINNAVISVDDIGTAFSLEINSNSALTADRTLTFNVQDSDVSLTLPATGTVATLAGNETFTNKTINGGNVNGVDFDGLTASNTSRLTLPKDTKANLLGLTRKEATLLYASDEELVYVDNGTDLLPIGGNFTTYTTQTLTNGGQINLNLVVGMQYRRVQGTSDVNTGASPDTASTTPFGTSTPSDGVVVRLVGMSDSQVLKLVNSDISKGALLNGDIVLGLGDIIDLQYDAVLDRYIEIGRN